MVDTVDAPRGRGCPPREVSEIGEQAPRRAHGLWAAGMAPQAGSVSRGGVSSGEGLVKSQRKGLRKARQAG